MRSLPQLLLTSVAAGLILTSCSGSPSSPIVRNYQSGNGKPIVTPQSLCARQGLGYNCGGGGDAQPCDLETQASDTTPPNPARTTIGVGETINIKSSNAKLVRVTGGGGTLSTGVPPAVFTAGDQAGSATVQAESDPDICTPNTVTFTIIAPTISYYNAAGDNNVYHVAGLATIGRLADTYLGPATVSFSDVSGMELPSTFSATGSWYCRNTHTPMPASAPIGYDASRGWHLGTDQDYILSCYSDTNGPDQFLNSNASFAIPTEYILADGGTYPMNTVTFQATGSPSGQLTISKDQMNGVTSVSNPGQGF